MPTQLPVTLVTSPTPTLLAQVVDHLHRTETWRVVAPEGLAAPTPSTWVSTVPRRQDLGSGCSCCIVRADLQDAVTALADDAAPVLVALEPGEDLDVAVKSFTVSRPEAPVPEVAQLRGLAVCLAPGMLTAAPERALIERVELASTVIIVGEDPQTEALVAALNPVAKVHQVPSVGDLAGGHLSVEGPFDLAMAQRRSSEPSMHRSTHASRAVFREVLPFNPGRLHRLLNTPSPGVLRVQGVCWVVSRPGQALILDGAGTDRRIQVGGMWWAAIPQQRWPESPAFAQQRAKWHPAFGDRCIELVISGTPDAVATFLKTLAACVLTEQELNNPEGWADIPDPFQL